MKPSQTSFVSGAQVMSLIIKLQGSTRTLFFFLHVCIIHKPVLEQCLMMDHEHALRKLHMPLTSQSQNCLILGNIYITCCSGLSYISTIHTFLFFYHFCQKNGPLKTFWSSESKSRSSVLMIFFEECGSLCLRNTPPAPPCPLHLPSSPASLSLLFDFSLCPWLPLLCSHTFLFWSLLYS